MECHIEISAEKAEGEHDFISDQLRRFSIQFVEPPQLTPLNIFARTDEGELIAGLLGETVWHWLYVMDLWVNDAYRHLGLGTKLMAMAETEAIRRGCQHVYLDTFDFQACGFYPKLGYTIWGTLDEFPPGHQRIYFKKDL